MVHVEYYISRELVDAIVLKYEAVIQIRVLEILVVSVDTDSVKVYLDRSSFFFLVFGAVGVSCRHFYLYILFQSMCKTLLEFVFLGFTLTEAIALFTLMMSYLLYFHLIKK